VALREISITTGSPTRFLGRDCVSFDDTEQVLLPQSDVILADGSIEMDLAVTGERSFPGVAWRINDDTYESFFVRPHQVGNPDSVQYTPVFNGVSAWQLYHGPGYWESVAFPINSWFTLRVAFAGSRGEAYIDGMGAPALVFGGLKVPASEGRVGIQPGGSGVRVARFAVDESRPTLRGAAMPVPSMEQGTIAGWLVSRPTAEGVPLDAARDWQFLETEPSGLANLARLQPLTGERNTVFARCSLITAAATVRALDIGFSDRAVVYLNGTALFAGNDSYRTRDYRFLGSIGYWDTIYLPLRRGANELVVAVSESFGGWGLQARLRDPEGITVERP